MKITIDIEDSLPEDLLHDLQIEPAENGCSVKMTVGCKWVQVDLTDLEAAVKTIRHLALEWAPCAP